MNDDYNPYDSLLIAQNIYLAFDEGGKAVATTPNESAWLRFSIICAFLSAFHKVYEILKNDEEFQRKAKNSENLYKLVIQEALERFKFDELVELYELRIKAEFVLPPEYNVSLKDVKRAIELANNIITSIEKIKSNLL